MGARFLRPSPRTCGVALAAALLIAPAVSRADVPVPAGTGAAPTVEDLKKRGNQAMMELNYAEALEAYRAAVAQAPDDAVLYYNLGRAHQAREEYPAALDALETFAKKATPELRARVPKLEELLADVRSRVATVELTCSVDAPNATIAIGPKTTVAGCGIAPKMVRVVVAEKRAAFDVRLTDETLQAQASRVNVVGGAAPSTVALVVLPKASSGRLLVKATPSNASISVDGVLKGTPPVEIPLPPGQHMVDVKAESHEPAHVPIVIDVGATRELSVPLERSAPMTSKWWFWTGVGVAAVGAGVLLWVLIAEPERSADVGTIPPGQAPASFRF